MVIVLRVFSTLNRAERSALGKCGALTLQLLLCFAALAEQSALRILSRDSPMQRSPIERSAREAAPILLQRRME